MTESQGAIIQLFVIIAVVAWSGWMILIVFPALRKLQSLLEGILAELKKRSK